VNSSCCSSWSNISSKFSSLKRKWTNTPKPSANLP